MFDVQNMCNYIGEAHSKEIQSLLENCEQSKLANLTFKNPKVALMLSIFTGFVGIDRLYQGGIKMMGVKLAAMVLTFGTWYIADIYYTKNAVQEQNYQNLLAAVNA